MRKEPFLKQLLTLYLPLTLLLIFILFPFYWIFITSIKPEAELYGAVTYWPRAVTWENYKKLFTTTVNFVAAMKNSFTGKSPQTSFLNISSTRHTILMSASKPEIITKTVAISEKSQPLLYSSNIEVFSKPINGLYSL